MGRRGGDCDLPGGRVALSIARWLVAARAIICLKRAALSYLGASELAGFSQPIAVDAGARPAVNCHKSKGARAYNASDVEKFADRAY